MTGAWKLAARNLRRHRRRNLVTGSAIALGYAGLLVLGGYAIRIERLVRDGAVYAQRHGHVAVYAKGGLKRAETKPSAYALPPEAQERILSTLRGDPRVELVGRYLLGSGIVGNGCRTVPFRATGVEPDVERQILSHPEVVSVLGEMAEAKSGRTLAASGSSEGAVVLARRLASSLGKAPAPGAVPPGPPAPLDCEAPGVDARFREDPFVQLAGRTEDGGFGALDGEVVGTYQATMTQEDKAGLVAPLELLQRLYGTERVSYVAAYLRDFRQAHAVARDVEAKLAAAGLAVSVYPFDDKGANPYYVGTIAFLGALVFFILILVANVVALSVLNAMTLAVLERSREMGTLRAVGFTRRELTGLYLREAALLTLVALAVGLALGLGAAGAINAAGVRFEPPGSGGPIPLRFTPNAPLCAGAAFLFLLLSLAATWIAVRRRARAPVASLVVEVAA